VSARRGQPGQSGARGRYRLDPEEAGRGPTVAIGTALDQMLRGRGMEDAVVLGRVVACWEDVVGPQVAQQVRPRLVRSGELVLAVDHPAWATELELSGPRVLARLGEHLGDMAPTSLSVRVEPAARR
jgi:predicted nucleic acid-binding Zn ribbon protein